MDNWSLIYNPDQQKILDYHKELLKATEQERLAIQAMKTPSERFTFSRGLELLRHIFAGRSSQKFPKAVSPTR